MEAERSRAFVSVQKTAGMKRNACLVTYRSVGARVCSEHAPFDLGGILSVLERASRYKFVFLRIQSCETYEVMEYNKRSIRKTIRSSSFINSERNNQSIARGIILAVGKGFFDRPPFRPLLFKCKYLGIPFLGILPRTSCNGCFLWIRLPIGCRVRCLPGMQTLRRMKQARELRCT